MKPLVNMAEEAFRVWAELNGWEVTKKGWPDFICRGPDGALMAVEVKGPNDQLRHEQSKMLKDLNRCGMPTFTWTMETGLHLYPKLARGSDPTLAARVMELEALLRKVTAERDELIAYREHKTGHNGDINKALPYPPGYLRKAQSDYDRKMDKERKAAAALTARSTMSDESESTTSQGVAVASAPSGDPDAVSERP